MEMEKKNYYMIITAIYIGNFNQIYMLKPTWKMEIFRNIWSLQWIIRENIHARNNMEMEKNITFSLQWIFRKFLANDHYSEKYRENLGKHTSSNSYGNGKVQYYMIIILNIFIFMTHYQ